MKLLLRALALSLLLLPVALLLALATSQGTRNVLDVASRLLPVEIDYGSGSLVSEVHLRRVLYQTQTLRLQLDDVVVELSLPCLWRSALCFQQLQARNLDIAILPGNDDSPPSRTGDALRTNLIEFPLPMETDALQLQALRVHWRGGEWRQAAMDAKVRLRDSVISVLDAEVQEPHLVLSRAETNASADPDRDAIVMPVIDLPLALSVERLQLIRPSWDFFGEVHQQDLIELQGHWLHRDLQLAQLQVQDREQGNLSLQGSVTFADKWPLHADLAVELAPSIGWPAVLDRKIQLSAEGDLATLELQLSSSGKAVVGIEGEVNLLQAKLPFTAKLHATSKSPLALADIAAVPAAFGEVAIESPVVVRANGSLVSQQFEVQAVASGLGYEALGISLKGQREGELLTIADLSLRDSSGSNALRGSGSVALSEPLQWSLAVQSDGLNLPRIDGFPSGRMSGKLHVDGQWHWQGKAELNDEPRQDLWQLDVVDVALQGVVNDLPARVTGYAGLRPGWRLASSALDAEVNGAKLSLHAPGDGRGPGHLQLSITDIGRWQAGSRGQLQLAATVSADRQQAQADGSLQGIVWNGLSIDQGTLAGTYRDGGSPLFTLTAGLDDVAVKDNKFKSLALSAKGNAERHSVTLASQGDFDGELSVSGTWRDKKWQGQLAPTRLQTPMGQWQLPAAVALNWSDTAQQMTLAAHCWQHARAQLCANKAVLGREGGASVELKGDLQLFSSLLPPEMEVDGDLVAQATAVWNPVSGLDLRGRAQSRDVSVTRQMGEGQSASFERGAIAASFHFAREILELEAQLQQSNRTLLDVQLALPGDKTRPISGTVSVEQLQLAELAAFLPAFSALSGEVNGRLALAGTLGQPRGTGDLKLSRGHLALVGNPTELDGLEVNLDVKGDSAQLSGTAQLGGGNLQLDGRIALAPALQLELDITGANNTILYPPSTELQLSEKLKLLLTKELLDISGDVTVHKGRIEFAQLPDDGVPVSASVVEVDDTGNEAAAGLSFKIRTDVRLHIDNQLKVTGKSLDTMLGGDLHVQQRPGQPLLLFGNLNTIVGEVRAYQSRLQITRGSINFTGPPANPTLDVNAERHITSGDVTVGVHVRGPLEDDLLLEIYSTPAMSQADAISYLVRGRALDTGAGVDGTAAALSLASGVVNRSTLVSELNRVPGLSKVEFGAQGGESDTAATVSGYLGERLYLSYGVGLYEPINVLTARFYLRARLWVEVVSSLENSLDLYYSFDRD